MRHFTVVIHGTFCKNPVFIVVIRGTFPGKNSSASPGCYLQHNSAVSKGRVVMYGTFQTTRKFSFSSCYQAHISLLQDFSGRVVTLRIIPKILFWRVVILSTF